MTPGSPRALDTKPRWRRRLALIVALAVLLVVLLVAGGYGFIFFREAHDPSGRVGIEVAGQRQWLVQPTGVVTPRGLTSAAGSPTARRATPPSGGATRVAAGGTPAPAAVARPTPGAQADRGGTLAAPAPTAVATATPTPTIPLPPLELAIPAIGVDVRVILVDNQHLMRTPAAGWLFGTAFPATAGNAVFLGHLDGKSAIFGRLAEVKVGDQIRVSTATAIHSYIVDSTTTVDVSAVEVLAPTDEAVVTVITCAGDWDPVARSYDRRLVVRGHYAAVEPR